MKRTTILTLSVCLGMICSAELPIPENPLWKPMPDDVYLQETRGCVETDAPILAVAVFEGALFAGNAQGVCRLDGEALVPEANGPAGPVTRLKTLAGTLWAATPGGLWRFDGAAWQNLGGKDVADMCAHLGDVVVAAAGGLYRVEGDALTLVTPPDSRGARGVLGVASYSGTLYVRQANRFGLVENGDFTYEYLADWGHLEPDCVLRDMLTQGSKLVFATDGGLSILRGMTWYHLCGEDGLCYEDTTCLAPGFAQDLWIGTARGAIRYVDGEFQYFGYQRWLPNDKVNAIACGDNVVYIATDGGLGIITYEPYTLRKKAAWYERWLEEWGQKRLGFTHSLVWDGTEWLRHVSDNDVGYSSHYLDAMCFKYAVTGDQKARDEAVDMMKSVKWSEEITPMPGFPARSIWAADEKGDKAKHGSGGLPAEWHATPDGVWEWKGDTSSDETDAHVYEVSLFLELVAEDGEERDMAIEHLDRVIGHIVDNGWVLRDLDGQPTRWARWDPEYLQRPYGFYARGLNGMEALNYVTTAYHFTGNEKFRAGKQQLIEWGYPDEVLRQKLTFHPGFFTHFDDRLAFYAYYPLLRYETDPELRSLWLRSLERSWEVKRIEGLPWFNFIYGAITGNDCETDRAVAHLREWPLDCRMYSYFNSQRDDLYTPKGYRMYSERPKPLSPRATTPQRWDANFMRLDGGGAGRSVAEPSSWLDAYWMGRYFGFIKAPTTNDPELVTVPKRGLHLGAEPYKGPPRPPLEYERAAEEANAEGNT